MFDIRQLAIAWQAVASSAAKGSEGRPALENTVHVEVYDAGIRLVATDSYILTQAFVPYHDDQHEPYFCVEPSLDEAPDHTFTVIDTHGRFVALMKSAVKIAKKEKAREHNFTLTVREQRQADGQFDGLVSRECVLDFNDGDETVALGLYDGEWMTWRTLFAVPDVAAIGVVTMSSDMVGRIANVIAPMPDTSLSFTFQGDQRAVLFTTDTGGEFRLSGLWMPLRTEEVEVAA